MFRPLPGLELGALGAATLVVPDGWPSTARFLPWPTQVPVPNLSFFFFFFNAMNGDLVSDSAVCANLQRLLGP